MNRLYPEDEERVERYLSSPVHQVPRKPFRPLLLLGIIIAVLCIISLISWFVAKNHGVI